MRLSGRNSVEATHLGRRLKWDAECVGWKFKLKSHLDIRINIWRRKGGIENGSEGEKNF